MYVCMYVRTYVCMYACMYVGMYVCMYVNTLTMNTFYWYNQTLYQNIQRRKLFSTQPHVYVFLCVPAYILCVYDI